MDITHTIPKDRVLITGGSGLLGREIQKLGDFYCPEHFEFDITDSLQVGFVMNRIEPLLVIHLAANNKTSESDILTNIIGTANLAYECQQREIRMVYTSTDYVYYGAGPHSEHEPLKPPYNFAWSKLGGECAVRQVPNHLILRIDIGKRPFPHKKVYDDQMCSKLYADEAAPFILEAALSNITGILNIGHEPISLADHARRTVPNIETIETPNWIPRDTSFNLTRWKSLFNH